MDKISLFRKYRSQRFVDIVGQEHITKTLQNALENGDHAQAYLFCGPRGTGKTSMARILAKSFNCQEGILREPCGKCRNCEDIANGTALDVVEIDAASHTQVDKVRDIIIQKIDYMPTSGKFKVYIIDEVHKLSDASFNALLKTLEEPPPHVIFILATTHAHELLPTILSRCQRYDFRRISFTDCLMQMKNVSEKEGICIENEALDIIVRKSDGSLRDCLVILEQISSFADKNIKSSDVTELLGITDEAILLNLTDFLNQKNITEALRLINELNKNGKDLVLVAKDFLEHYRMLLLIKISKGSLWVEISDERKQRLIDIAQRLTATEIMHNINTIIDLLSQMRDESLVQLGWEMAIMKMADPKMDHSFDGILRRLDVLEKEFGQICTVTSQSEKIMRNDIVSTETREEIPPRPEAKKQKAIEIKTGISPTPTDMDYNYVKLWPSVMEKIKREKISLYAVLIEAVIISSEKEKLVLGFKNQYSFHKQKVEAERGIIQKIIKDLVSFAPAIDCIITDTDDKIHIEEKGKTSHDDYVQEAMELFGGELI